MALLKQSRSHLLAVAAGIFAVTCGTPLVDPTFQGPVLYSLQGQVSGLSVDVDINNPVVRIAVFWSPEGPAVSDVTHLVEDTSAVVEARSPAAWTINIFDVPQGLNLVSVGNGAGSYAYGYVLAYTDTNGNHRYDSTEPLVSIEGGRGVLYTAAEISAQYSPTGRKLTPGFHVVTVPLPCRETPATTEGSCDYPLGQECRGDGECAGGANGELPGTCIGDFIVPWPHGACAVKYTEPDQCQPRGGTRVDGHGMTYWIEYCETDADCRRGFPYICDLRVNACMPLGSFDIDLTGGVTALFGCAASADADGGMPPLDGGRPPPPDGGLPPFPDGGGQTPQPCTSVLPQRCCGDGVCDGPENHTNCAADCP